MYVYDCDPTARESHLIQVVVVHWEKTRERWMYTISKRWQQQLARRKATGETRYNKTVTCHITTDAFEIGVHNFSHLVAM